VCLVLSLCCAEGQDAQPAPQQSPPPQEQTPTPPATVPSTGTSSSSQSLDINDTGRRFTGGLTLSVLGFSLIPGRTSTVDNSSTVSTEYQTQSASERIGYGLTGQVRITNHFSVDIGALMRKAGYQFTTTVTTTTTTILNGVTSSTTSTVITHQDTRARFFDFPLTVRYYSGAKRPNGPRWFAEGGGAWRWSNGVRTSSDTTDDAGVNTCCTFPAVPPAHKSGIGMVAGVGLQFIDPFGIHVVPEVRYTRWIDQVFDNLTTHTFQNQLDASISLTF
jgi:Outer membrane protein beta-barrel domain